MVDIVANHYSKVSVNALRFEDDHYDIYQVPQDESPEKKFNFVIKFLFSKNKIFQNRALRARVQITDASRDLPASELGKNFRSESIQEKFNAFARHSKFSSSEELSKVSKQAFNVLAEGIVDLTKFINNQNINEDYTRLQTTFTDSSVSENFLDLWNEIPNQVGPTFSYNELIDNSDFLKNFNGIFDSKTASSNYLKIDKDFKPLDINPVNSKNTINTVVPNLTTVSSEFFPAKFSKLLPYSSIKFGSFMVYVDLLNEKNEVIDTILKKVKINSFLNSLKIPKGSPNIKIQRIDRLGSKFIICNVRHHSKNVKYDGVIIQSKSNLPSGQKVTQKRFDNDQQVFESSIELEDFNVEQHFKAVYVNEQTPGYSFKSSIMKRRNNQNMSGFLVCYQTNLNEVEVQVHGFEKNTALKSSIFREDLTFKSAGKVFIADLSLVNGQTTFLDSNLIAGHIYRYSAEIEHLGCVKTHTAAGVVECHKIVNDSINFTVSNPKIDSGDLKFNVTVSNKSSETDQIISLTRKNDLEIYFEDKIKSKQYKLEDVIRFQINRIDLNTGSKANLGILSKGDTFSDFEFSRNLGIENYSGKPCMYEVIPHIVEYNDLLGEAEIKSVDQKNLLVNYSKFDSFYSRMNSVQITKESLGKKKGRVPLSGLNVIGATILVKIDDIKRPNKSIGQFNAELIKKSTYSDIKLSWTCRDNNVDYFMIGRNYNGVHRFIGKSNNNNVVNCYYIDNTSLRGKLSYSVTPIYNDGSAGKMLESTTEIID